MSQLLAALQMRNLTREGVSITYIPLCAVLDLAGEGAGVYIQSPAPPELHDATADSDSDG